MTTSHKLSNRKLLAPGVLQVSVALAATVVVAVCVFNSTVRLGQSFPGFFVWENLFVPAVGESSWTGSTAGLEYFSWVRAVNGQSVGNAAEFNAAVAAVEEDGPVEYLLEKDGRSYSIQVPPMVMHFRAWLSVLGIYGFNAVALLALGWVILYLKPRSPDAAALFYFCVNLSLYMATSTDIFGPYIFRVPYFFVITMVPVSIWGMLSYFPLERSRRRREGLLLASGAAAALAMGATSNHAFWADRGLLLKLDRLTHFLIAASAFAGIIFFGWHFFFARSRIVRQRTKVVVLGTTGAFIVPAVMLTTLYARGVTLPLNYLTLFFVLFPLGIGYAIAQHDLFGVDRVIKRALVYSVLSAFVFGIYTVTIGLFDYLFENVTTVVSRMAEGGVILTLILITNPSRARIQDFVDRVYDRRRYDYREVVRSTSRSFSSILDVDALVRTVIKLIDETLQTVTASVFTVNEEGVAVLRGHLDHRAGESSSERDIEICERRVPALAPLVAALAARGLVTEDFDDDTRDSGPALRGALESIAGPGALALAMRLEGRLVGAVVVGARRAGGYHSGDDVALLRTICDQLAVALENAQAYRKIDLLVRGLERNNVELEAANNELKRTQDLLVQKERLAAVGEISGAVAHAIRNPLAGIKAAAQLALFDIEDDQEASSLRDIVSETDRLSERITALLDFSRPFEPTLEPGCVETVVGSVVRMSRGKASQKDVKLRYDGDGGQPQVMIDNALFEQVIVELVANAIDASPDGGEVAVRTGHDADGGCVWVEVEDGGGGIPEDKADRIFELFFTTKSSGTGFGLATVKKIVQRHDGEVRVFNTEQGGACFRVELPVAATSEGSA